MSDDDPDPLVLLGREFEGFTRAFDRQFSMIPELAARHELIEISELEHRVLSDPALGQHVDVLLCSTDWLPSLISSGRLLPLDGYLAANPPEGWPDAWLPALRSLQTDPDGAVYGIAYHDGPVMLIYRHDLFEDASERSGFERRYGYELRPARTWDELVDQARFFNRPADGLYGTVLAGFPDEHNNIYDFLTQLWSRGGDLVAPDGRSGLSSDAARAAYSYLHDLWHVHRVIDPAAAGWDSVASGVHFAAGEAALMVNWCGFASLSANPSSPTHGKIGCVAAPAAVGPGCSSATMSSYWVLAVPSACRRPDRSYELIRRLSAREMDVVTAESGGTATRRDTWALPQVQALAPYYEQLEQAHVRARAIPRDPDWPQLAAVLNEMMRRLVQDRAGFEALDDADRRLQDVLASRAGRDRESNIGALR